jgi:biopolymer transport protein ExbB
MESLLASFTWFSHGGPVMYLLLVLSILTITIVGERLVYYRKMAEDLDGLSQSFQREIESGGLAAIEKKYKKAEKPMEILLKKGAEACIDQTSLENALESSAQLSVAKLKKALPMLSTVVTLSPLFGLLGTVVGMIQSFSVFNLDAGQPAAITGGVGEALIATASGLAIAVVALVAHSYFSYRLDGIITNIEQFSSELIQILPMYKKNLKRGKDHEVA